MPSLNWADFDAANEKHWTALIDYLSTDVLADQQSETVLTGLRHKLLRNVSGGVVTDEKLVPLLSALALFCANSEYVMAESPEETAMLRALTPPRKVTEALILDCYRPGEVDGLPLGEIRVLGPIADTTSRDVQAMYEENPYPRWGVLPPCDPVDTPLDVLVAGCGTGREILMAAQRYRRSTVTGIDLSRVSLAYTLARAREFGIDNVDLFQADILNVGALGKTFDLIRCSGVLHHMKEPVMGLVALKQVLKPGGMIRVMLYSKLARQAVFAARALAEELGVRATADGIREFRHTIAALPDGHPARGVMRWSDFYSVSGARDLMFHVHEHNYDIPEIAALVADAGLEVVSFGLGAEARFRDMGFTDPRDLAAWAQAEAKYPDMFSGMYGFKVARPGDAKGKH